MAPCLFTDNLERVSEDGYWIMKMKRSTELFAWAIFFSLLQPVIPYFLYLGKTSVTQTLLQRLSLPHVYVNLVDCYTPQILFENILNKVSGVIPRPSNKFAKYATCHNIAEFVALYVKAIDEAENDKHETT